MPASVRVGIMGAGSIGCFVGGHLALAGENAGETAGKNDVLFVGRQRMGDEFNQHGLTVREYGQAGRLAPADRYSFHTELEALADCHVVLCCVKSAHTESTAIDMAKVLTEDALIVSMQNGVHNAEVLRKHLGSRRVLAGIVDFNVVSQGQGVFQRTTSGPLSIESCGDARWQTSIRALRHSGLAVVELDDIVPAQWTKLVVNLNNAVSALSGAPTRELIVSSDYRKVVAAVVGEAIFVLRKAGIAPARLRGVPISWMPKILSLPSPIVRLVTRAQMKIDPEARSSMWEDLTRGRLTEIDYLNGEVLRLAEEFGVDAPVNRRIIELIRAAEALGNGPPNLSGPALLAAIRSSH